MTADWVLSAIGMTCVVLAIWHARIERRRATERCEAAMRGERKMHMEMEQNLLKLRNDALADLRNAKAEMADTINENADLRRRLARPKGRARIATSQGKESP